MILAGVVHPESLPDCDAAKLVLEKAERVGLSCLISADGGGPWALLRRVREMHRGQGTRLKIVPPVEGGCHAAGNLPKISQK